MDKRLAGTRVAFIATDGFEVSELFEPKRSLEGAGAAVHVVAPRSGKIRGWAHDHWEGEIDVDITTTEAISEDYDALVLPGGVINADHVRMDQEAVAFVREIAAAGRPIAAICHGPWILAEAAVVKDKTVTSYPSLRTDLVNAGARWVDEEVVVDKNLITSRRPEDLPAFDAKLLDAVAEAARKRAMKRTNGHARV
jgi:protease I